MQIEKKSEALFEIKGVKKRFGRYSVLDSINLAIQPGEIVGLLGPNGCGKTTTLRIAAGFAWPDTGQVILNGSPISPDQPKSRRSIGYLPERSPVYDSFNVARYLSFVASAHNMDRVQASDSIEYVLNAFDLELVKDRTIGHLSKGYKQRIGLAQALISKPKVLLLDEPTNGLDPRQLIEARKMIKLAAQDKAVIFSTHIVQEIEALCTRVVYLDKGILHPVPLKKSLPRDCVSITVDIVCAKIEVLRKLLPPLSRESKVTIVPLGDEKFNISMTIRKAKQSDLIHLFSKHSLLESLQVDGSSLEETLIELIGEGGKL
ncbi:MAG: ABC transporter ATP-binding protein [Proteobacteria bacterium]|nr:ABC transporter ATP-binding protein [Pseudomonadota bacterium]MBT7562143.1 ABC transporter ATP-binding protein [Pseudomonadota bacterium]